MGIYRRYKQAPSGFRNLIELLESTIPARRQKMIDAGLAEDADYTRKALSYVMEFDDIVGLSEAELGEIVAKTPARILAYALHGLADTDRARFLSTARRGYVAEVEVYLESIASQSEISAARLKMVTIARGLERSGIVKVKPIPDAA